jgi:hypothetical protein
MHTFVIVSVVNLSPIMTAFRHAREANTCDTRANLVTVPVGDSRNMKMSSWMSTNEQNEIQKPGV